MALSVGVPLTRSNDGILENLVDRACLESNSCSFRYKATTTIRSTSQEPQKVKYVSDNYNLNGGLSAIGIKIF